jgi:hypothetical protein
VGLIALAFPIILNVKPMGAITPYSVAVGYQYFGENYCLHLQGEVNDARKGSLSYHNFKRRHHPEDLNLNVKEL